MQPVFLIGDITLAKEILDKRSAKFSSRPNIPYNRYVDPAQVYWALTKQNESHFIARRLATGLMAAVRAGETDPLQQFEALLNVTHLLDDGGKNWFHHMDRFSASMVLSAAFGLHCPTGQEPDLKEVVACGAEAIRLLHPTASIINVLPFLDLIPGPMPWRKRARTHRNREDALYDKLITRAVSGEASGMNTWAAVFAREDKPEGDQRQLMTQFTNTAVSMHTFILACILHPEWIPRAQREIDAIVGEDRLPSETLRWRPAVTIPDCCGSSFRNSPPIHDSDSAFSGQQAHHEIFANGPFEFPAVFEPRSVQRAEVARQEWAESEKDLNVLLPRHKER
ncbi:cytochrome P450 [Mycena sanguinolenta]|nr:cytochrome P450 [Mycena sanguinolenta]